MNGKEQWLNETMRRLLKTYGGQGRQLCDLCESGVMSKEDAEDYKKVQAILTV